MNRLAGMLLLATLGCGSSDPTTNPADLNGSYVATTFTVAVQGVSNDVLAAGGAATLTINPGQTTAGQLTIPASAGGPIVANLAGTYRITGKNTIQYVALSGGNYLDGFQFTSDPPELRGIVLQPPTNGLLILTFRKQ